MNGYFQLECKDEGTFIHLYPAKDDGEQLSVKELAEYLAKKKIECDIRVLNTQIIEKAYNGVIQIDRQRRFAEREMMNLFVSEDNMTVEARFYPPSIGGPLLGRDDIIADLNNLKIVNGIDQEAIEDYLKNPRYCENIVIAKGTPPRHGTDAHIEYFFSTDLSARPAQKEDGSVDFFNLDTMNHVKAGDLLARLTKEDPGEHGMDVFGARVKARDVKKLTIKYDRNISANEDGTEVYSDVNGHVVLVESRIFVSDVYEVENVDNSTGNIDYDGSVKIRGNVNSNFSVRARGDIEVMGVVEGATLEADRNIIVAKGINGMGKGNVRAGGNIIAKYIENATVFSGGYVESEAIMHSQVSARTDVNVTSRKGIIAGSTVNATNSVNVKTLGSQMGSDTVIQLGIDPTVKERREELKNKMEEDAKKLKQLKPFIEAATQKLKQGVKMSPDQMKTVQGALVTCKTIQEQSALDMEEMDRLEEEMNSHRTQSQITVRDIVFAGTKVAISDVSMVVKTDMKFCKFYRKDGDIKMASL